MIRKVFTSIVLGLLLACLRLACHSTLSFAAAYPCNINAPYGLQPCQGYFNGGQGTPTQVYNDFDNVLPAPALKNVTNAGNFESIVRGYLYSGNYQSQIGGAFIIDTMLNHGSFRNAGGNNAGVNYAKNNFARWQQLVDHYANAPNGASYGVKWNVQPSYAQYCGSPSKPTLNSTYLPNIQDDVFHATICPFGFTNGTPIIEFYWSGGNFQLGKGCANVEMSDSAIPVDNAPTGTITLSCNISSWQQVATVNFSDPDGSTTGYITTGGWTSGTVSSGGSRQITIPQSATSPYNPQTVSLWVKDVGKVGTNQYQVVGTANTQVPCATLSCGSMSVTPAQLDPFMAFSMTVNVTNSVNQAPAGATMNLKVAPPAGATYTYNSTQNAGGSGGVSTATFTGIGPTNASGVYTATWTLQWASGSKVCSDTLPVVYMPYLSVFGGDVSAGSSPESSSGSCVPVTNANSGIYSWNNHTTDFSGGGAQYAVDALGAIVDFASSQNASNSAPTSLSFANYFTPANASWLNQSQGLFGGYAALSAPDCDFTSDITTPPTVGDTTIGAATVANGTQNVQYVQNGDVYINGNIVYANSGGGWTATQIPYFRLVVVGGNIYIGSNVTQLDGLYVAEPSAGGIGGHIYTCATALGVPADPTIAGFFSTCNKQLVINGAFIASQVQFLRTFGSVGQAKNTDSISSNHSGEVFNYTPELWVPRAGNAPNDSYTAITGLPPVL